jgi:NADPH:quinone reductase-like Zn-dependent oxidoreductase
MKALIYRNFGPPEVLEWVDGWPDPEPAAQEVLVRTVAGGLNPKDVLLRKGRFRMLARTPLPRVSGLDAAGHVVAVGSGVRGFAVGDAVCGMTNTFAGGVHAELARFHADEIVHCPANLSMEQAATVPLAAQTALQALRDCGRLKQGQRVLINGASGGVGHFAVQIAKAMGAQVHAVCGPRHLDFVTGLGADAAYSYADRPAADLDLEVDLVLDVFGKETRPAFGRQLGRRGIYVSTVPKPATLWAEGLARAGLSRIRRLVQVRSRSDDLKCLKDWIEGGTLRPHLEKKYPVSQAADAHRHIESKHTVGKICIVF